MPDRFLILLAEDNRADEIKTRSPSTEGKPGDLGALSDYSELGGVEK